MTALGKVTEIRNLLISKMNESLQSPRHAFSRFVSSHKHPQYPTTTRIPTAVLVVQHLHGVLELKLDGVDQRNALGRSTIERIESLASAPPRGTRVILLTGEAPDFCSGYDLYEAASGEADQLIANGRNFASLKKAGVPVIAALHGNVIGGGLELALAADVRLATADTKFALPAVRLGLVYSEEGVRLLVNEVGESRARAMLLAGMVLNAEEARNAGIVSEIVELSRLHERALALASTIASWSTASASGNRKVLDVVVGRSIHNTEALRQSSFQKGGELSTTLERYLAAESEQLTRRFFVRSGERWRAVVRVGGEMLDEMTIRTRRRFNNEQPREHRLLHRVSLRRTPPP